MFLKNIKSYVQAVRDSREGMVQEVVLLNRMGDVFALVCIFTGPSLKEESRL